MRSCGKRSATPHDDPHRVLNGRRRASPRADRVTGRGGPPRRQFSGDTCWSARLRAPSPAPRLDSPVFVLDDPDYYCFRGSSAEGEPPSPGAALRALFRVRFGSWSSALATVNGSSASRGSHCGARRPPPPCRATPCAPPSACASDAGPSCSGWASDGVLRRVGREGWRLASAAPGPAPMVPVRIERTRGAMQGASRLEHAPPPRSTSTVSTGRKRATAMGVGRD